MISRPENRSTFGDRRRFVSYFLSVRKANNFSCMGTEHSPTNFSNDCRFEISLPHCFLELRDAHPI